MNAIAHASNAPAGPKLDNRRVLAALIDLLVIGAAGFSLVYLISLVAGGDASLTSPTVQFVMFAWALYYYFALESGGGQTLGKKAMKLRVVKADGTPVGMREVAVRTILRAVDGLFAYLVGLIVMMATGERRQRLGDLAAGTMVADASGPPAEAATEAVAAPAPAADAEAEADSGSEAPAEPEALAPEAEPVSEPVATEPQPAPAPTTSESTPPTLTDFDPYSLTQPVEEQRADVTELPETAPVPEQDPEPEPPSLTAVPEPAAAEPAVDEPVAAEPAVEDSPADEPVAAEPAVEDSPAEESVAAEPAVEDSPAEEPVAAEPVADEPLADEPVAFADDEQFADWSEFDTPDEPQDGARGGAGPTPEESLAALMGNPAPSEQPVAEQGPAVDQEPLEPAEEQGEDVTIRSVETVSAIDLVMGEDEGGDDAGADDDETQPQQQ